ncbi:hypothetical protein NL676_033976 [Syzygium grande]|nr:hypothetical protein NL676_033976 [Syzygium grande]
MNAMDHRDGDDGPGECEQHCYGNDVDLGKDERFRANGDCIDCDGDDCCGAKHGCVGHLNDDVDSSSGP